MKILHVAPINVAGIPYNMAEMQRLHGHDARLVTLHDNALTFPEDICLHLPLPRSPLANLWRDCKRKSASEGQFTNRRPRSVAPRNLLERAYFAYDDWRRQKPIEAAFMHYDLDRFEVIHFDGGLDFFRDARTAQRWKDQGKKIVCHYMGSDLRLRGVHPVMDTLSDLNLTNESDHLLLHPNIKYIFMPFNAKDYSVRTKENDRLRIIHSPSNRTMKGTKFILPIIEELKKIRSIDFLLIEYMPHEKVLRLKQTCDIAIEQVGNLGGTGYGRNSLETLAMGIPTITEMTPDYLSWIPDNPFILATPETLLQRLTEVIDDPQLRKRKASEGRAWVERYHSYEAVNSSLEALYRDHGIF